MQFFFLSGLPRSGSTLLGSLVGQRPDFTVTPTSPILDLLCATNDTFKKLNVQYTFDWDTKTTNVYRSIIDGYFKDITTPYVLDKHRGYPKNVVPLKIFFSPEPKILCTIRPIADIISSYISLIQNNGYEDNFVDSALNQRGLALTTENRANLLWEGYLRDSVETLRFGIANHRENLHFVHYDDLVTKPAETMGSVYDFFGLEKFEHNLDNVENKCAEDKDHAWGLKNLHSIRAKVKKTSKPARKMLGRRLEKKFNALGEDILGA